MRAAPIFAFLAACVSLPVPAAVRNGGSYAVKAETTDGGGAGRSSTAIYANSGSVGGITGIASAATPPTTARQGFMGQVYEAQGGVPGTPVLSPVTIGVFSSNSAWARPGSIVVLEFTASEPIQPPSVTLLGAVRTPVNDSGNHWTVSAVVGGGTAEGPAAFSITAMDLEGHTAPGVVTTTNGSVVTVDRTAPILSLPASLIAEATSASGRLVTFSATATDNFHGAPSVSATPASGSIFPIGTTTVNVSSSDAAGNQTTGSFTITVRDTTAPVVASHPNVIAEATSTTGAVVNYSAASAADAVGVTDLTYSPNSGTIFPIGTTTVTITATDAANNTGTGTFTVTVLSFQQTWRQLYFGTASNTGNAADDADPDGDGVVNLLEWACNLNPTTSSTLPTSALTNGSTIEFTYLRSIAAVTAGAIFTVEWSDTMGTNDWHTTGVTQIVLSSDGTTQQMKATVPSGGSSQRFVRLRVTGPP